MPYGYIPSPFGGRPSSVDIAKAVKRDEDKDQEVRDARVTPQSRANRIDSIKFLDDFFSGKDHDFESDRGRPDGIGYKSIDKSEDKPWEEREAMRTPNGRARAIVEHEGRNPYSSEESRIQTVQDLTDRVKAKEGQMESLKISNERGYDDNPLSAEKTPNARADTQPGDRNLPYIRNETGRFAREDTGELTDVVGYDHIDKSEDDPWEERNAKRTPMGRARAVEGVTYKPDVEPDETMLESKKESKDMMDALDGGVQSRKIGARRGDYPYFAAKTPENRATLQTMEGNAPDRGEFGGPGDEIRGDYVGHASFFKAEDESIDKGKRIRPLIPNETPEDKAKVTPQGRARNVSRDSNGDRATSSDKSRTYTMDDALELKEATHRVNPDPSGDLTTADGGSASTSPYGRETNQFYGGSPSRVNEEDYDEGVMDFVGTENKYTKSESSPVAKSINQMIYERVYKTAPYSIYERRM